MTLKIYSHADSQILSLMTLNIRKGSLDKHKPHTCGATFGIEHLLFSLTHTLTHSLSLVLVVMMRSTEFNTSRSVLLLIL